MAAFGTVITVYTNTFLYGHLRQCWLGNKLLTGRTLCTCQNNQVLAWITNSSNLNRYIIGILPNETVKPYLKPC